ncbi:MAG: N-acetylmuramoyl-L-alanine amidase [Nocardioides sp.]
MRHIVRCALLCLVLTGMTVVAPTSTLAVSHTSPTAAEQVSARVATRHTFHLEQPAAYVATYWRGNPTARVRVAFSSDGVHFTGSVPAGRDELGTQRDNGTTYGALRWAEGAVAVRVVADRPLARVTVLGLRDGADRTTVRPTEASAAEASTDQPAVVSRSAWAADPDLMTWDPKFYPTRKLIVHHTDTPDDYADRAGAKAQIRAIYYYHSVTQGWGDIGYNFLIDKFGNVYEGRYSRNYAGANPSGDDASGNGVTAAHTAGWNSGTVGIAMLGTFTSHDVTPAAREALEALLTWQARRNNIDPEATEAFVNPASGDTITTPNIAGHRDYGVTSCPGDSFYATLPVIRSDVAARLAMPPPPDTTAPTGPSRLSADGRRSRVSLTWAAARDNVAVTGYQVFRSRSAKTGFDRVATTTRRSYTDSSLARRRTYYYKVRARDAAGNVGPFTATKSARTT